MDWVRGEAKKIGSRGQFNAYVWTSLQGYRLVPTRGRRYDVLDPKGNKVNTIQYGSVAGAKECADKHYDKSQKSEFVANVPPMDTPLDLRHYDT